MAERRLEPRPKGSAVCLLESANRDEVAVADVAHVFDAQGQQSLGTARGSDEFDFQCIRGDDFDSDAEVSLSQPSTCDAVCEGNSV